MSLSAHDITRVLREIEPALHGGWIQKIHQPAAQTLVFEVRVPGRTHRLLISCSPDSSRLHLLSKPLPNPPSPPVFCQFLRAHFHGAHLDYLRQIAEDRLVEWHLTTHGGPRRLVCELTGRHANLLVVDADGTVLRDLYGTREFVGKPYVQRSRQAPPSVHVNRPWPFPDTGSSQEFPLSAAIEAYYQERDTAQTLDAAREARSRAVNKAIKKQRRLIEAWERDLAGATKFRLYARYGELLKASLSSIKKGIDRIVLVDYFDESLPEVTIPLDTTKSARGNMEDYFRKHRKYVSAERELKPRIEQAQRVLSELRQESAAIQEGTWAPPARPATPGPNADRPVRHTRGQPRRPFRRFTSADGLPIYVGRNAKENDELTFSLAQSDDLWLHARGAPGSHVVVRLERGKEPPNETLMDAATLALLYSDLKKSGKGDVVYTKRKWVKKAKGQAAGAVLITREQSLHITLDKPRLVALRDRSAPEL